MVKGSLKIVRDAQYEAQQRTVEVSLKPALGKNLFSDGLIQASAGAFNGHFQTERFVHSQIREYTLRAAQHWADVRSVLPANKVNAIRSDSVSMHDEDRMKDIHESIQYRAAAETMEQSIGLAVLPHVPKDLRVCVLAQMLHELDVPLNAVEAKLPVQVQSKDDRANLKMRLALRRIAKAAGLSMISDAATSQALNRIITQASSSKTLEHADGHSDVLSSERLDKKIFQANQSAIIILGLLSFLSKTSLESKAFSYCGKSQEQIQKHCESECFSTDNNERLHGFHLSKAEGYGTAPIWYQQAMATGPPGQASRWE
jgi:hypothetical protein